MTYLTYCDFHLGDNLFHLHFLRKLALRYPEHRFQHAAHECHLPQMKEVVKDLPAIRLVPLGKNPDGHDAWKNAGGFFQDYPGNWNYYEFYVDWFRELARRMGLESPIEKMTDLLFDYPALRDPGTSAGVSCRMADLLFVNSQPCSGQWLAYDDLEQRAAIPKLIRRLAKKLRVVVTQKLDDMPKEDDRLIQCTREAEMSVTGIGHVSLHTPLIIMIGTGPAWPTCNAFNRTVVKRRFVLLEPERVNYEDNGITIVQHAASLPELEGHLADAQIL